MDTGCSGVNRIFYIQALQSKPFLSLPLSHAHSMYTAHTHTAHTHTHTIRPLPHHHWPAPSWWPSWHRFALCVCAPPAVLWHSCLAQSHAEVGNHPVQACFLSYLMPIKHTNALLMILLLLLLLLKSDTPQQREIKCSVFPSSDFHVNLR